MKTPLWFAVLFLAATAFSDEPKKLDVKFPPMAPSIEVKEVGTGHQVDTTWQSGYGSFDKSFTQHKKITTSIYNSSRQDITATMDVLWIATKAIDRSIKILTRQTMPVQVAHGFTRTFDSESPKTTSTWLHLHAIGEDWMSGAKMAGWIVILRSGEKVLNFKSASVAGTNLMADPDALEKLLSAKGLDSSDTPATP